MVVANGRGRGTRVHQHALTVRRAAEARNWGKPVGSSAPDFE
jgi:hypothetical protein